MSYHHGDLANAVIDWVVKTENLEKILALDLETRVLGEDKFLTNELILAISLAYFQDGKVQKKLWLLEEEDSDGEAKLLFKLNEFLLEMRPLVLVGFNLAGYDVPLLHLKMRQHQNPILWGVKDTIERSFLLDIKHIVKFELAKYSEDGTPKIYSLAKAVEHKRFANLPLMRTKRLVSSTIISKGKEIYSMWKTDKKKFVAYAEGDAHDVLLIFAELFSKQLAPSLTV